MNTDEENAVTKRVIGAILEVSTLGAGFLKKLYRRVSPDSQAATRSRGMRRGGTGCWSDSVARTAIGLKLLCISVNFEL
jgi:hypothetical protein